MNAEDAFSANHDRSHFFASSVANVVLAQLQQGLDHERPIIVLTGEADVGKSSVVREACARWGARVRAEWLAGPALEPELLLAQVVELFGSTARGDDSRPGWLAALSRSLGLVGEQDQTPLLIVEDAHALSTETLVELADIHAEVIKANRSLRVILLGVPELARKLDDLAVDALAQRVSVRLQMGPLPAQDVRHYLHHRIAAAGGDGERVFSRKAARELHTVSRGVPGLLDQLAVESIRAARTAGTTMVGQEHVRAAVTAIGNAPAPAPGPAPAKVAPRAKPPAPQQTSSQPAGTDGSPDAAAPPPAAPLVERRAAKPALLAPTASPAPPASPPRQISPLDSRHPRVKEWVSRFTEDDAPTRFGARAQLPPITEPEELPVFEAPEFGAEFAQPSARLPARSTEPFEAATAERAPELEQQPTAYTPQPSEPELVVFEPDPSVFAPKPIAFRPEPAAADAYETRAAQANDDAHDKRGKRRKRERERAAAEAHATSRHDGPLKVPDRDVAPPVLAVSSEHAPARRVIIDQSMTEEPPVVTVTPAPPPARKGNDARPPGHGRFLHVVVPGMLMLGVAAAAIIAGTRGGFDHDPPGTSTPASSAAQPTTLPEPIPQTLPAQAQVDSQVPPGQAQADSQPPSAEPSSSTTSAPSITPPSTTSPVPNTPSASTTFSPLRIAPTSTTSSAPRKSAPAAATAPATPKSAAHSTAQKPAPLQVQPTPPDEPELIPRPDNAAPAHFCLAVGTYLFNDRAHTIAKQLSKRTRLKAWVETVEHNGSRSYRIMIGDFATDTDAEQAADRMLGRGLVSEATVHPLSRGHKGR